MGLEFQSSGTATKVSVDGLTVSGSDVANLQVRNLANVWTDVGYFAGNERIPVTTQEGLSIASLPGVPILNFPAVQQVEGSVSVSSLPSVSITPSPLPVSLVGSSLTQLPSLPGGTNTIGHVSIVDFGGTDLQLTPQHQVPVSAQFADGPNLDAFERLRTSESFTIFSSKQLYDKQPLQWAEKLGAGVTSTYNSSQASTTITVPASSAVSGIRQTKQRFNYQAGKSQLIVMTGALGAGATGITRRIGAFDANDGLFFQLSGTTLSVVQRSSTSGSPVNVVTNQSNWNLDKLDGTGSSGLSLDVSKGQIFVIDYQWLGTGRVRYGFFLNGRLIYCHQITHSNSTSIPYTATSNFPLRYEIVNDGSGAQASIIHSCATVNVEGGQQPLGFTRSVDRGVAAITTGANTNLIPLLSIQLKPTQLSATVLPTNISIMTTTKDVNFRWALLLNPSLVGPDAASWTLLSNSSVQYDVSRTVSNVVSGGTQLDSGYGSTAQSSVEAALDVSVAIGADVDGVQDQLVLAVQNVTAGANAYFGSMAWRELQ